MFASIRKKRKSSSPSEWRLPAFRPRQTLWPWQWRACRRTCEGNCCYFPAPPAEQMRGREFECYWAYWKHSDVTDDSVLPSSWVPEGLDPSSLTWRWLGQILPCIPRFKTHIYTHTHAELVSTVQQKLTQHSYTTCITFGFMHALSAMSMLMTSVWSHRLFSILCTCGKKRQRSVNGWYTDS